MEDCLKTPEWVATLENKKKHKLAHDVGAGAPCLNCLDACLGLDLHFWRKLCRNCKCKKEAHDIKEEDNYEQFQILFGENALQQREGMKKFAQDLAAKLGNRPHMKQFMDSLKKEEKENIKFDWLPSNVPVNVASEYMQQLPLEKLPIAGTEGSVFRRQQLEKQIPMHDFNVNKCHDLSSEETQAFSDYVENLKSSVVGQGYIAKIPSALEHNYGHSEDGNVCNGSQVPHGFKSSLSNSLNVTPKPFKPFVDSRCHDENGSGNSASLPDVLRSTCSSLKPPSAFIKLGKGFPTNSEISSSVPSEESFSANEYTTANSCSPLRDPASNKVGSRVAPDLFDDIQKKSLYENSIPRNNYNNNNSDRKDFLSKLNSVPRESYKENVAPPDLQKISTGNHSRNAESLNYAPANHFVDVIPTDKSQVYSTDVDIKLPIIGNNIPVRGGSDGGSHEIEQKLAADSSRTPKIRFGNTTFIDDVGHLTDRMSNLPLSSEETSLCYYCHHCKKSVLPGEVAVLAERAGVEFIWHPKCFVCTKCEELLVDLIYFFHKENVYCGRHYAEVVNIPRCYACDELIFLKEYTVAEGHTFHIKHFCCFQCDTPLAGMQYVPKDDHPVCLSCYNVKYGKECYSCHQIIGASDERIGLNDMNWHATNACFKCFQCLKPLFGGRFAIRDNHPFCSKECIQQFKSNAA